MGRTVAELSLTISERELTEWMVLDAIEPFGDKRLDTHMAVLATAIFNAAGATKGDTKQNFRQSDFLPLFDSAAPKKQDVNAQVRRIFGVPNGR